MSTKMIEGSVATGGMSSPLVLMDKFRALLAKAETLEDIADLRSKADAVRVWAKSAAMGLEAQNRAAELKLRAERKAGDLLSTFKLRGGDRKSNGRDDRLNLANLGINQSQSKRWQMEARVPEAEFEVYVKHASEIGEEITAAGLLRLARKSVDSSTTVRESKTFSPQDGPERNDVFHVDAPDGEPAKCVYASHYEQRGEQADQARDLLALIEEISNHHELLCNLLSPVCAEHAEPLRPSLRKLVSYYLSETGRLLDQSLALQRAAAFARS